jgi:hypothetical protein
VVVDDFDIDRARKVSGPLETDSPLAVDANAVLTLTVTPERFQAIAA